MDTVFAPSFGNRPSSLIGRDDLLASFEASLQSRPGARERACVILGQRGSGKTVLLWEFADLARANGFVVANPTTVSEGMLERIVEKIQDDGTRYIKTADKHASGATFGALGFSAGLQFEKDVQETKSFQFKLTQLARRLTQDGHGILILVDELQANSSELRQIVIAYQELVGEGLNIALVMAGLPAAVSATLNDKVLTFLNRAQKTVLEPLAEHDIDAFYADAFDELELKIDSSTRRSAAHSAQGSPYLMQLIGHHAVMYARKPKGKISKPEVTKEALDEALVSAQDDFENDVCTATLSALSDRDVDFLSAMALSDEDAPRMRVLSEKMGVTQDYAQKYRKRLLDAGVIEVASRGRVRFAVPFLRERLRKEAAYIEFD